MEHVLEDEDGKITFIAQLVSDLTLPKSCPYYKEVVASTMLRSSIHHVDDRNTVDPSVASSHTTYARLAGGALRYKYDKRRNAHVKPTAQ